MHEQKVKENFLCQKREKNLGRPGTIELRTSVLFWLCIQIQKYVNHGVRLRHITRQPIITRICRLDGSLMRTRVLCSFHLVKACAASSRACNYSTISHSQQNKSILGSANCSVRPTLYQLTRSFIH